MSHTASTHLCSMSVCLSLLFLLLSLSLSLSLHYNSFALSPSLGLSLRVTHASVSFAFIYSLILFYFSTNRERHFRTIFHNFCSVVRRMHHTILTNYTNVHAMNDSSDRCAHVNNYIYNHEKQKNKITYSAT